MADDRALLDIIDQQRREIDRLRTASFEQTCEIIKYQTAITDIFNDGNIAAPRTFREVMEDAAKKHNRLVEMVRRYHEVNAHMSDDDLDDAYDAMVTLAVPEYKISGGEA